MFLRIKFFFSFRFYIYRSFGRKYIKYNSYVFNYGFNVISLYRFRDRCSRDNFGRFGFRYDIVFNILFIGLCE